MQGRHQALTLLSIVALCAAGGCGDDQVGVPQPEPLASLLRSSFIKEGDPPQALLLAGLPGACHGEGQVAVETPDGTVTTRAAIDGSFTASVTGQAGTELQVRFESSAPVSYRVKGFSCGQAVCQAPLPPGPRAGVTPVTLSAAGAAVVEGETVASRPLVLINRSGGRLSTGASLASGAFRLEIAARSGDALQVTRDEAPLSPAWSLTVP